MTGILSVLPTLTIIVSITLIGVILLQKSLSDGTDGILTPPTSNTKNIQSGVDGIGKLTRILIGIFFILILLNGFISKKESHKHLLLIKLFKMKKERNFYQKMNNIIRFITIIISAFFIANTSMASVCKEENIIKILDYINSVKTFSAKFKQITNNSDESSGTFLLSRPNKARMDYESGSANAIVVMNGKIGTYYDKRLKQLSHTNISNLPARIWLKDKITQNNTKILQCVENGGVFSITVQDQQSKDNNKFTMSLKHDNEENFMINSIAVESDDMNFILVAFSNQKINEKISNSKFILKDPRIFTEDEE